MRFLGCATVLVDTLWLIAFAAHVSAATAAPGATSGEGSKQAVSDPTILRAVIKICKKRRCESAGADARVEVWRDGRGRARVLIYDGAVSMCATSYHDRTGKFLFRAPHGVSEPEEWEISDRKIRKLTEGLSQAEHYLCGDPKTAHPAPPAPKGYEVRVN